MAGKNEWHVIGRGFSGWHATGINVSSSGGDIDPGVYWTGAPTTGYREDAVDGCLIYDASESDDKAFAKLVISGPMVDPSLGPDDWKPFTDREAALRMAPLMEGTFQALAILAATQPQYGGLDYIGVNRYRALLAAVPGVKLGTVTNGIITWEG